MNMALTFNRGAQRLPFGPPHPRKLMLCLSTFCAGSPAKAFGSRFRLVGERLAQKIYPAFSTCAASPAQAFGSRFRLVGVIRSFVLLAVQRPLRSQRLTRPPFPSNPVSDPYAFS
jgi:hypothetical protein